MADDYTYGSDAVQDEDERAKAMQMELLKKKNDPANRKSLWESLDAFMADRHNTDELTVCLFVIFVVLDLISDFAWSIILKLIAYVFLGVAVWRTLSKNDARREKENDRFLSLTAPISLFFNETRKNLADKEYRYMHCPECKSSFKIKRVGEQVSVTCPSCGHKFITKG
ncbi:MAG: zinc-ribbon domain-containing protein [Clostridia bacterium]|nr:zinc-ribbon domain-containing protein [Clostridia bacterium]